MGIKDIWQAAAASGNEKARAFLATRMEDIEEEWRAASAVVFAADEADETAPADSSSDEAAWAVELENEDVYHMLESLEKSGNPLEHAERQSSLFRTLAKAYPDRYLDHLVKWLGTLSDALGAEDRPAEALDCIVEAIEHARKLKESGPDKWTGLLLRSRAVMLLALAQPQEALASYREALQSAFLNGEILAAFREEFAGMLDMIGMELLREGRNAEVLPYLEERAAISRQIVLHDSSKLADLALALSNLGVAGFYSAPETAQSALTECAQIRRGLAASVPGTYLPLLAIALNNLGEFCRQHGDLQNAHRHLAEAVAIRRPLAMSAPEDYGLPLIRSLNNLLLVLKAMDATAELFSWTATACEELLELTYANAAFFPDYVSSLLDFADVRVAVRRELAEALGKVQLAIRLCERMPSADSTLSRALALQERILSAAF
jgi:tetratricopeptide (TPR) repeat protein